MVRTGMIALVVAASAVAGCKGKGSGDKAKDQVVAKTEEPAPKVEPRIPSGTVPVALPKLASPKDTRRVASAKTFVTITKDGEVKQGKLAAGADPYAGQPHERDASLEAELFGVTTPPPADPPAQDDPPPPPPDDDDRAQGQYKMHGPSDDEALARQQAIDIARKSGVLGSLGLGGAHAYGELDTAAGTVDTLILADRETSAFGVLTMFAQLAAHKTALGVDGGAAPDAVAYRFTTQPEAAPAAQSMIVVTFDSVMVIPSGAREPTIVPRAPSPAPIETAKVAAALRPSPMTPVTGLVTVQFQADASVQDLADLLGALASVGAPAVEVTSIAAGFDDVNVYGGLLGNEAGEMSGGFGYGSGGVIGHGAGPGYGSNLPQVRIGQPNAVGDLDKAIIRRYIKRNIAKITYCYEKQLLNKPDLKGTVTTQFFINPDGYVTSANASGVDPEVADCLAEVIKAIEFPKPKGGGGVQVNYPFTFRPTGG